jgi:hypothetical protein
VFFNKDVGDASFRTLKCKTPIKNGEKDVVVSASDGMLRHRFTGDEAVVMQGLTGRCSRALEFFTVCVCEPLRMLNFLL